MKNRIIVLIALITGFLLFIGIPSIQAQPGISKREQVKANLTPEQRSILEANHSSMAEARKAFKATLTAEQISMLQNNSLTMEQKRANLRASLNAQQQQSLNENRQMHQMQKQAFRKTMTVEQKQLMKKTYLKKMKKMNTSPGLRRLPRRLRR